MPLRAEDLARLPKPERDALLTVFTPQERDRLNYCWEFWARPNQLPPPGEWSFWLLRAGRGFGKSRSGAEWAREQARLMPGSRGALVARTAGDVRDVLIEGESGILAISPPWFMPRYEPSKRRLTWPNSSIATTFSADEPDSLRGPQHHWAWCDELAAWRLPEAWNQLCMGLRLGNNPRAVITTTPRPTAVIRELRADPATVETVGTTYDNLANLAPTFLSQVVRKHAGTRLGRQELLAELLDDNPGALWKREWIDRDRVTKAPPLLRVVVGVDPAGSTAEGSADTGIIVAGCARIGSEMHCYIIDDRTIHGSPAQWGGQAVSAYNTHGANLVVGELNYGGDMVEHVIRTAKGGAAVGYRKVHASRGKAIRAEPIAQLAERGLVHHVGAFGPLEDELCQWDPADDTAPSPNRLDAMVWAATELMLGTSYRPTAHAGAGRPT